MGRQYLVFLFRRGTEQPHQGGEEAERNKALIEQRRQDEAARTKAVADELVALDEGLCRHGVRKAPRLEGWECEDGGGVQCDDEVGRDGGSQGVGL
jgi:hypothetical protein